MQSTPAGYESKPVEYFEWARPEMLSFVPQNCRRILDVGCGAGGFGETLKRARNVEVWGVEPVPSVAQRAAGKLDRVIEGDFGPGTALPEASFDCVVFNDVLEHMVSPEAALRRARHLLAPQGVVVASLPNVRSFPTIWQLVFHARWEYQDSGVMDRTHLRFFTKSSIVSMFEAEGFEVDSVCGINAYSGIPNVTRPLWAAYKLANLLLFGGIGDMKFQQFAVVAKLLARS